MILDHYFSLNDSTQLGSEQLTVKGMHAVYKQNSLRRFLLMLRFGNGNMSHVLPMTALCPALSPKQTLLTILPDCRL